MIEESTARTFEQTGVCTWQIDKCDLFRLELG